MSHILDYEVPVDYTPLDALARIFTDHKQDMRKTDVYKGKITTPRDVTPLSVSQSRRRPRNLSTRF